MNFALRLLFLLVVDFIISCVLLPSLFIPTTPSSVLLDHFLLGKTAHFYDINQRIDSMSASNFCCTHPQQRIDSPELPARQLAAIDSIFAAAALPEDHPHALKFPARKSELHPSIMRSPNMATKIKLQFWRKSMKSLGREKDYDEDAHRMSSQEVLNDLEEVPSEDEVEWGGSQRHRFGSTLDLGEDEPQIRNPAGPYARSSFLRSLEYLRPLIQRFVSIRSYHMTLQS